MCGVIMKAFPTINVELACRMAKQFDCWLDAAGIEEPRWRGPSPIDAPKWHTMMYMDHKWHRVGSFQSLDLLSRCIRLELKPVSEINMIGVEFVLLGDME